MCAAPERELLGPINATANEAEMRAAVETVEEWFKQSILEIEDA
jgi:hypothetical protein